MTEMTDDQRTGLLAQLSTEQVAAIQSALQTALKHQPPDFSHPNWAAIAAHQYGKSETALTLLRAIAKAKETVKAKESNG